MLYESIEHRAELKLSRHVPNCSMFDLFRDFYLVFFFITESEISERASGQVATAVEPNKFCNLRYYKVSRDKNPLASNSLFSICRVKKLACFYEPRFGRISMNIHFQILC